MGVSWVLECTKCKKAEDILRELEYYDPADALEAAFYLYQIEDAEKLENVDKLLAWIGKHQNHGGIRFAGYP